jgi:hypothetical protein
MSAVSGLSFSTPKESSHSDHLSAVKSSHHKTVRERGRVQALPDRFQRLRFVLVGRLGEGSGLELQRFEAKLLVSPGISFGQASDVHSSVGTVFVSSLNCAASRENRWWLSLSKPHKLGVILRDS